MLLFSRTAGRLSRNTLNLFSSTLSESRRINSFKLSASLIQTNHSHSTAIPTVQHNDKKQVTSQDKEVMLHLEKSGEQTNPVSTIVNKYGVVVWQNFLNRMTSLRARRIHPTGEPEGRDVPLPINGWPMFPTIAPHRSGFTCGWMESAQHTLIKFGHFNLDFKAETSPINVIEPPQEAGGYASWLSHSIATSAAGTTGVALFGEDSSRERGVYFRGFESDGTAWNDAVKITSVEGDRGHDIASIDNNNFCIVYATGYEYKSKIYMKKVNYLGQELSDDILLAESISPDSEVISPRICISKSGYICIAWMVAKNQIEYQVFDKNMNKISLLKTVPMKCGFDKIGFDSDDEVNLFAISFSSDSKDQGVRQIYLYKTDYSGNQKLLQPISTLPLPLKFDSSIMILNHTAYYSSWRARDFSSDAGDIFGRFCMFPTSRNSAKVDSADIKSAESPSASETFTH